MIERYRTIKAFSDMVENPLKEYSFTNCHDSDERQKMRFNPETEEIEYTKLDSDWKSDVYFIRNLSLDSWCDFKVINNNKMLKIDGYIKVHKVKGCDKELLKTLRDHAEGHCHFDHYISFKELKEHLGKEKVCKEEFKDKKFIIYAGNLLKFMKENKINAVRLKGFHYKIKKGDYE